jgi:hypothetical protein
MITITITETSVLIPKSQTEIIIEALKYYRSQFGKFNSCPTESESYKIYDIMQLEALMSYDIRVDVSEEEVENFSVTNGIDFPTYV